MPETIQRRAGQATPLSLGKRAMSAAFRTAAFLFGANETLDANGRVGAETTVRTGT